VEAIRTDERAGRPIVFVVDDDSSVRKALLRTLKSVAIEAEGFDTAAKFLERRPPRRPSCLVLDVRMPGLSGLDLQEELGRRGLGPAIVFITGHGTVPTSVQAMKRGAVDFLQKPFDDEELLDAIHKGLEENARRLQSEADLGETRSLYESLTPREREVFSLVASGLLNKQVASRLGTSEKTVKVHRGRVMRKMKAASLAELGRMDDQLSQGTQLDGTKV
jgi:FixJ family two-component response regulator